MHKRITCLVGSGATIEISAPSTYDITKAIEQYIEEYDDKCAKVINYIKLALGSGYNFEDIVHCLEDLLTVKANETRDISNSNEPILKLNCKFNNIECSAIRMALRLAIEEIRNKIIAHCDDFEKNYSDYIWFADFWRKLSLNNKLDIVTLNYDNCIERVIGKYTDGFTERNTSLYDDKMMVYRFIPLEFTRTHITRLMHIHGCVTFGKASVAPINKNIFRENFHDIYNYKKILDPNIISSDETTQAGEYIVRGSIITGHRKSEKLLVYPYEFYHFEFQKALINNRSLLIVGYSFGDLYINDMLLRMVEFHGNKLRIVLITKLSKKQQLVDNITLEQSKIIGRLFKKNYMDVVNEFMESNDEWVTSDDNCMRIYFCGFRAATEHKRDIFRFLNS